MTKFCVWVATPTFLYLPVYALDRLGVLQQVAKTINNTEVEIRIVASPEIGDGPCIRHMLDRASNQGGNGEIHIAVADPFAAMAEDPKAKEVRLLGAFLKAPTFWVVGRKCGTAPPGQRLHCYNTDFDTANAIAKGFRGKYGLIEPTARPGEEIDRLFEDPAELAAPGQLRVLTSDIIGMELAMQQTSSEIDICEHVAQHDEYRQFLTTGVLTHERVLRTRKADLSLFMEALRAACLLLRTAKQPTAMLIQRLSHEPEFRDELRVGKSTPPRERLDETQSVRVAERIFDEGLYNESLLISHAEWAGRVDIEVTGRMARRRADSYFFKIYRDGPARRHIQTWIGKAMGDYLTFAREAKNRNVLLGFMVLAMVVLFSGYRCTDFLFHTQQVPQSTAWDRVGHVMCAFGLFIGVLVAAAPILQYLARAIGLNRFPASDQDHSFLATMLSPGLALLLSVVAFAFTDGIITDGYRQALLLAAAATAGTGLAALFFRIFPRFAHA